MMILKTTGGLVKTTCSRKQELVLWKKNVEIDDWMGNKWCVQAWPSSELFGIEDIYYAVSKPRIQYYTNFKHRTTTA